MSEDDFPQPELRPISLCLMIYILMNHNLSWYEIIRYISQNFSVSILKIEQIMRIMGLRNDNINYLEDNSIIEKIDSGLHEEIKNISYIKDFDIEELKNIINESYLTEEEMDEANSILNKVYKVGQPFPTHPLGDELENGKQVVRIFDCITDYLRDENVNDDSSPSP